MHQETRGATPNLTRIKHLLREWIESRLTPLSRPDEDTALAFQLNADVEKAGLSCDYFPRPGQAKCPDQNMIGFLGDIKLHRSAEFLVMQTAVGIQCGEDESAYIYEWKKDHWQRFWQSEQYEYTPKKYLPQYLEAVLISHVGRGADKTAHLVVTLGGYPGCVSNWHPVYYHIWQVNTSGGPAKLLVDGSEMAFISDPVQASVGGNEVLIEYTVGSADPGVHSRRQIRHYVVKEDAIEQVDPFVLGPRDFVDNWLSHPSRDLLDRTPPKLRNAIESWHKTFKGYIEFIQPTLHCLNAADLYQVGIQNGETRQTMGYFQVRWRPPYHFSMVGISERPWPNCTEKDPQADEFRTLFPDREFR